MIVCKNCLAAIESHEGRQCKKEEHKDSCECVEN